MTCEAKAPAKPSFPIEGGADCMDVALHSHDSFCTDNHKNWLINSAGLGAYAHGRVHQEGDRAIFVGDMVHKRGYLETDDLLKMEEQSLESMGDPLTTNSKMGRLLALYILPEMNTANGEGVLIGYYEAGVVSFDTFKMPRETRISGEGEILTQGWDTQRLVNHLLNTVSAVGKNAVAVTPRDHFFRSHFGLHFLKTAMGEGSFNPENTNRLSQGVQPLLDADPYDLVEGAACGSWERGSRLLASFGMVYDPCISPAPFARGMVALNQAMTFTEDRTPIPAWEGAWVPDYFIAGIHKFENLGLRPVENSFGFVASDKEADTYFVSIDPKLTEDRRENKWLPIEWDFETAKFTLGSLDQLKKLADGSFEGVFGDSSHRVRVFVRTDRHTDWMLWHEFSPCDKNVDPSQKFRRVERLGIPPRPCREASWYQFRVEGVGEVEVQDFSADITPTSKKSGKNHCVAVGCDDIDPLIINKKPIEERWPELQSQ